MVLMTIPPIATHEPPPLVPADVAGRRNMVLLTQLRWAAMAGQLAAILYVSIGLKVSLPIVPMLAILIGLAALNIGTLIALRGRHGVTNGQIFAALVVDWVALTAQLYLSGGATNPFASVGLLQVVLGAVLLDAWSSWTLLALHSLSFGALVIVHRPIHIPPPYASLLSPAHIMASWLNFLLVSVLLVLFVTRIGGNLRARDARLAELRQRQAEEDHIVRMGLLASGAAHELGTPLASIQVILGDWRNQPAVLADPTMGEEVAEMQIAVARCKEIVTGILYASGEPRGERIERVPLRRFLTGIAADWQLLHPDMLIVEDRLMRDVVIAADRSIGQVVTNLLDNAKEAGARHIALGMDEADDVLRLTVRDDGPGFSPDIAGQIGKPYVSTRARKGAGLGLFLAVNVLRKLGGNITVENNPGGGAEVRIALPIEALTVERAHG